jgi:hypothetical protein
MFGWLFLEVESFKSVLMLGVDRTFSVLSFVDSQENLRVLPPVPQERVVSLANKARMLLNWSDNKVKIWRIEEINESEFEDEDKIEKRYLLEMDLNVLYSSTILTIG